jgi:methionyl-tRNA formyltransferase
MRIAFVGLPLAALLLAADGHSVVWAGLCRRGALGTRRLTRLLGAENVAVVPDLARSTEIVRARRPDLLVSWFWTKKIPRPFRSMAKLGALGVHPSLLPRHRGADPTFWAIDAGDGETGVTAHRIDDEYDTGAILGQTALRIDPSSTAWTLARRLDRPSLALLRRVVRAFAEGRPPQELPQDDRLATEAPAPTEEMLELDWTRDAAAIARRVRAASPWPGAYTEIGEALVTLTEVRVTDDVPAALVPGEAVVRADGVAVVRAADRGVELRAGRAALGDDEDERPLDGAGLAALVRAEVG